MVAGSHQDTPGHRSPLLFEAHTHMKMQRRLFLSTGTLFANNWVETHEDKTLKEIESAEYYLESLRMYELATLIANIMFAIALAALLEKLIAAGVAMIVFSFIIKLFSEKFLTQGITETKIAEEWIPLRKSLLKNHVFNHALETLEREYLETDFVPCKEIRIILVKTFDAVMKELLRQLEKAHGEGRRKKEAQLAYQMNEIKQLAKNLGLRMSFEESRTL